MIWLGNPSSASLTGPFRPNPVSLEPLWLFPGWTPLSSGLEPNLDTLELPPMCGRHLSSHPEADGRCPPLPRPLQEFLLVQICHLSLRIKQLSGWGVKGTYFPVTPHIPKIFYCPADKPVLTYLRGSQASILFPRPPLALRYFLPPHFGPFSLCEGLSTAFLSNSQRGGRFSCEPELLGTVASGGCEEGHCGPELLPALGGLGEESLQRSSAHSEPQPRGRAWPDSTVRSLGLGGFLRAQGCCLLHGVFLPPPQGPLSLPCCLV